MDWVQSFLGGSVKHFPDDFKDGAPILALIHILYDEAPGLQGM